MHSLATRVLQAIRTWDLVPRGGRVLAAVSGGSDSVALLHLLTELAPAREIALVGVAHFNHRLRGAAADADERFCRDLAARLSLPIDVEGADVAALARDARTSIEDAARTARYAFLERARVRAGADRVAVGHTRDDQAETFLLRLLRGAGPRGLAAIYPRSESIVRPLIDVSCEELRAYLGERGEPYRDDESNRDLAIPRNRVRHELIPYLRQHLSPGVVDVLAREAAIAREDAAWLERATNEAARQVILSRESRVEIDAAGLAALPPALGRRVARQALQQAAGGRFVGFEHVEALMALAAPGAETQKGLDLPGQRATRAGPVIVLEPGVRGRTTGALRVNSFRYPLSIPGEVAVAEAGVIVSAAAPPPGQGPELDELAGRGDWAAVAAARLAPPLAVRNRRPGDVFRPLGLGGRKKLQDFFVDRKVAQRERDTVPLVVDGEDRIVWVVGQAVADDFRVTAATEAVIILKVRRLASGGQEDQG